MLKEEKTYKEKAQTWEGHVRRRRRLEWYSPKPRDTWSHQRLEEAGSILPWNCQREYGPVYTLISDFRPPELGGEYISVVLSHSICGTLLQQTQETFPTNCLPFWGRFCSQDERGSRLLLLIIKFFWSNVRARNLFHFPLGPSSWN